MKMSPDSKRSIIRKAATTCPRCFGMATQLPGGSYCNECGLQPKAILKEAVL